MTMPKAKDTIGTSWIKRRRTNSPTYGRSLMTSRKTYEQYEGGIGMRAKKIRIEIRALDSALREAGESFEKIAGGKRVKGKTALYFSNIKDLRVLPVSMRKEAEGMARQQLDGLSRNKRCLGFRNVRCRLQSVSSRSRT